jgi:hypothetical protein
MKTAIMIDQPGSFVVFNLSCVIVATMYSKGVANAGQIVSRVLSFRFDLPFFACGMNIFNLDFINIVQTGI